MRYDTIPGPSRTPITRRALTRSQALGHAADYFDSGAFRSDLGRRVAYRTESQEPERAAQLRSYLSDELLPSAEHLGFTGRVIENPAAGCGPFLLARRREAADLPTVSMYGHGDV